MYIYIKIYISISISIYIYIHHREKNYIAMETHHLLLEKTQYFHGHGFNSYVTNYQWVT